MNKSSNIPLPLLSKNKSVDWWFAFKLNTEFFEGCGNKSKLPDKGLFGGNLQKYDYEKDFSLQYVVASSDSPILTKGRSCLGSTLNDPLGATFNQVYNGNFNYLLWNDQFTMILLTVKANLGDTLKECSPGIIMVMVLYYKFLHLHGLHLGMLITQEKQMEILWVM